MRRRSKILLVGGCGLIALAAVCFFCFREREPFYNGRTLSEWFDYRFSGPNAELLEREEKTARGLAQISTNAIPTLLKWHNRSANPYWLQEKAKRVPGFLRGRRLDHFVERYTAAEENRRTFVQINFETLGTNALRALPELVYNYRVAKTPTAAYSTANLIACLGQPGFDFLVGELTVTNTEIRRQFAALALSNVRTNGIQTGSAFPALNALIKMNTTNESLMFYQQALDHLAK